MAKTFVVGIDVYVWKVVDNVVVVTVNSTVVAVAAVDVKVLVDVEVVVEVDVTATTIVLVAAAVEEVTVVTGVVSVVLGIMPVEVTGGTGRS